LKTAIVIGGGIAGCSTAYALAKRGIPTALIERHAALAQEASGNPVGVLYPKLSVKPSLSDQLQLQGFDFTKQLLATTLQATHFQLCGLLQLAHNQSELNKQLVLIKQYPARLQLLDSQQASELAGVPLSFGGVFWSDAGWLRPSKLCEVLSDHALIQVVTADSALSILQNAGKWRVQSEHQSLDADIVVICNAADLKQFSQCQDISITPVRGQINFALPTEVSRGLKTIVCTDHFIAPAVDNIHAFGTSYARNRTDASLCEEDTQSNVRALRQLSPALYESLKNSTFTGRVAWRTATQDYTPLAGELVDATALRASPPRYNADPKTLPWLKGLFVNAGHGSKGMITAPLCAEFIAGIACGEPSILAPRLAAKMSPNRFVLRDLGLKLMAQTLYG
jgi:tRNA 5-methylaminomethyl-2-thiouridine biosynthesis bifunctional protein